MLALEKLIPKVCEVVLNNIHFIGMRKDKVVIAKNDIIERLLSSIDQDGSKMMKFKISNIDLNCTRQTLVNKIINIIIMSKNMISLDLSWGKLRPKDLVLISKSLTFRFEVLRNLNLSYNRLSFTE